MALTKEVACAILPVVEQTAARDASFQFARSVAPARSRPTSARGATPMESVEIQRHDRACRPVLSIVGEIDLVVRHEFRAALRQLVLDAHSPAYVDMSAVTFCDSTAVNALIEAQQLARSHNVELIITPSRSLRSTMRISGLAGHFHWGSPPARPSVLH